MKVLSCNNFSPYGSNKYRLYPCPVGYKTCYIPWERSVVSYPGLLTPAFVACSTNNGEGLVKLSYVQWCTWMCGKVAHSWKNSKEVNALPRLQTWTVERLSTRHQTVLATFLGSESRFTAVQKVGTSYHMTQFYQAFPHVSAASDKHWGEKAWARG